jgi:DNA-directed RNA polymerase subunit N (RpoN/RPB10)
MLPPVLCFTCGKSLGDIAPFYHYIRRTRVQRHYDELGVAPTRRIPAPGVEIPLMADVLDALRVTECCKTHLVTTLVFTDYY